MMKYIDLDGKKLSGLTLGTVQLGMNYGIANHDGKPDEAKSFAILRAALENGVTSLDTARGYGDSEEVIGRFLKTWKGNPPFIATKIPKLQGDTPVELEKFALNSIETSLQNLGLSKVNTVMLHSAGDIALHGAAAEHAMRSVLNHGYTDQVGVSVYTAAEVEEMLKYDIYSVTQLPMSIFDQRLIANHTLEKLSSRNYTVFVRSVFLQGLFFLNPDTVEDPILVEHAVPKIRLLQEIAHREGLTVAQLAIAFMRDCGGISSLVLGADTSEQVLNNIACFDTPPLNSDTLSRLKADFSDVDIPEIMKVLSRPKQ